MKNTWIIVIVVIVKLFSSYAHKNFFIILAKTHDFPHIKLLDNLLEENWKYLCHYSLQTLLRKDVNFYLIKLYYSISQI